MSRRKHQQKMAAREKKRQAKLQVQKTSRQSDASAQGSAIASAPAPPATVAFESPQPLSRQDSMDNCDVHPLQPTQFVQLPTGDWAPAVVMSEASAQRQSDLEYACMILDACMVQKILEDGSEDLMLGGLHHLRGNSPLQMAVDALLIQLDWLLARYPADVEYRDDCRARFYTIMNLLSSHMNLWEMTNTNYEGDHALRKLAYGSCDWRLVSALMDIMDKKKGSKFILSYVHGASNGPFQDYPHVFGYLVEKLINPCDGQDMYWYHPCGVFIR